jgi:hypothetical protein
MKIATVIKRLTLLLVPRQKRLPLREGYSTLVNLGWPTRIITCNMCDKAEAGVMRRYVGIQSWIAYKQEWEWAESTNRDSGQTLYSKSID